MDKKLSQAKTEVTIMHSLSPKINRMFVIELLN